MGICSSMESTELATSKLILQDGTLQEFSYPIRVSYILQKNPTSFICNSDEMEFDDVVSAVNGDEILQPGQLYFMLPLRKLKHRLTPEEMAALAVKASSALMKSGGCRRTLVSGEKGGDSCRKMGGGGGGGGGVRRGRRQRFTAMLSAIPE